MMDSSDCINVVLHNIMVPADVLCPSPMTTHVLPCRHLQLLNFVAVVCFLLSTEHRSSCRASSVYTM